MRMKSMLITLVFIICAIFVPLKENPEVNAQSNNIVIVFDVVSQDDGKIVVDVNLEENSGIAGMLLTLEYDDTAFHLENLSYGSALASLDPIHTDTNTSEGFKILPFKINYLGDRNDNSTGKLVTFSFTIKESVPDGDYLISFVYTRNKDVFCLENGKIDYKNPLIDRAKITFSGNVITQIQSESNFQPIIEKNTRYVLPIVLGSVVAVIAIIAIIFVVKRKQNGKRWTKL